MKIQRLLMLFASAAVLMVGCEKLETKEETIGYYECTLQKGVHVSLDNVVDNCLISFDGQLFHAEDYNYMSSHAHTDLASVGKVDGVSYITTIPGNWCDSTEVNVGHGYVTRTVAYGSSYYQYARLYVTELVKDASGNILAVKFRYATLEL